MHMYDLYVTEQLQAQREWALERKLAATRRVDEALAATERRETRPLWSRLVSLVLSL